MIEDQMELAERVLKKLEEDGWEREELPGPGDLLDAIRGCDLLLLNDPAASL